MKVISNEDGDFLIQFDIIRENDLPIPKKLFNLPSQIRDTPKQKLLLKNHHTDANKGKI